MNPINLKIEKQHHLTIMLLIKYEMLKCNSKHAVLFRYSSTMLLEKSILWEIEKAMNTLTKESWSNFINSRQGKLHNKVFYQE
jgi:hypothetical protein